MALATNSETFYDAVANRHRLFYRDWHAYMKQEGAWLDGILRPFGVRNVLDCTCGIGTQAIALALNGYDVAASDLSDENLAVAQRGAAEFGVSVMWHRADVRFLDRVPFAGPFDAVVSLGNSLPHLLTETDMQAALRQMVDQTRPGGLVIVGQRDWDAIAAERPRFRFRHEHKDAPAPGLRTVLWDLWSYDDPLVTFEVFFSQESADGWQTEVYPLRYRMWQRAEVIELMEAAGLSNVRELSCDWEVRLVGNSPK